MTLTLVKASNNLEIIRQSGPCRIRAGGPGLIGRGLPSGGATNQVIAKASGTSFDLKWAAVRELLTATRTYYVSKTGSDNNNGLTSGTAFLTIQKAINAALSVDMSIYAVTISVGAGTFNEGTMVNVTGNGNARITIQGAGYASTSIVGTTYGISAAGGVSLILQDVDISGSSICVTAAGGASISFAGTCQLSGGAARLVQADAGGQINAVGNCTIRINASSAYIFYAQKGGVITLAGGPTIVTTMAITVSATVYVKTGGIIACTASTVTWNVAGGAITGSRYSASLNGVIDTVTGGGASYFPGSTAGTPAYGTLGTTGGICV